MSFDIYRYLFDTRMFTILRLVSICFQYNYILYVVVNLERDDKILFVSTPVLRTFDSNSDLTHADFIVTNKRSLIKTIIIYIVCMCIV